MLAPLAWQPVVDAISGDVRGVEALAEPGQPTRQVVEAALHQCSAWSDRRLRVPVRVRISTRDLLDTELAACIERALLHEDLPAELLYLEVAERSLRGEPTRGPARLEALHALGVRIALDAFRAYAYAWPIHEVKLDAARLARSSVERAHERGWQVVATGIADLPTAARAASLGCDSLQGEYWPAYPSSDALGAWLMAESDARRALAA
jgi:EAL domain-containing protein (putative c-di-GMP-specific phosphodiesterase class I)